MNAEKIIPTREALDIKLCQYGVYQPMAYEDNFMGDCGKPAVAVWRFGKDDSPLYVCEKHDIQVEEANLEE